MWKKYVQGCKIYFFRLLVLFYNRNRKYSVLLSVNMIVDGYKQMNIMYFYFGMFLCWMLLE